MTPFNALRIASLTLALVGNAAFAQVLVMPEVAPPAQASVPDTSAAPDKRCPAALPNILGKWRSKGSSSPYETIEITIEKEEKVFRAKVKRREDADQIELQGTWEYRNCRLQVFLTEEDTSYHVLIVPQALNGPLTGPSLSLKKIGEPFRAPYTRVN